MLNKIRHEEIGGGYTMQHKIILDAADLRPIGGQIEVAALDEDGNELELVTVSDESAANAEFDRIIRRFAGPLQNAVNAARLVPGRKYTLVFLNDFGFPVAEKITFDSMRFATYAQHSDVVKLIFTPYRKRTKYSRLFYNCSLLIFDGWQNLNQNVIEDILKDDGKIRITKSKYSCFSASYIEDLEQSFDRPVMIYKDYKKGANGKVYT